MNASFWEYLYWLDSLCRHGRAAHTDRGCLHCPCRRTYRGDFR